MHAWMFSKVLPLINLINVQNTVSYPREVSFKNLSNFLIIAYDTIYSPL